MSNFGFVALFISSDCSLDVFRPVRDYDGNSSFIHYAPENTLDANFLAPGHMSSPTIRCYRNTLLIPCDTEIIDAMLGFADMQRHYHADGEYSSLNRMLVNAAPYYHDQEMKRAALYQQAGTKNKYIGGPLTAYGAFLDAKDKGDNGMEPLMDKRQGHISRARLNCWTGVQGLVQYIGGLDLADIDPRMPYFYRAHQMQRWVGDHQSAADTETSLFANLRLTFNKNYHAPKKRSVCEDIIAHRKDTNSPPYFIMQEGAYLNDILDTSIDFDDHKGIKIKDYLNKMHDAGKLAKRTAPGSHRHMQEGQERVAASALRYNSLGKFLEF